ncbi:MAG: thioredoxin-related protein [Flavobacteriales bacterium]|jgi:thioredoxin-related protein
MKKITLYFLLLLLTTSCHKRLINELQNKNYVKLNDSKVTLVMINANGCGYSNWAKKDILPAAQKDSFPVYLVTSELDSVIIDSNVVHIGGKLLKSYNYKLFPQFLLVEPNGKFTRLSGWNKERKEEIFKAMSW